MPTPSYALALHTASSELGLAIDNFAGDRRSQVWDLGRDLSSGLHLHLQEFLQPQCWSDLMFLAVEIGPGGFTGTRIGVVTARTLAQQLDLPLFGISTLAAVAWQQRTQGDLAIQLAAQRGAVHGAIYRVEAGRLMPQLPDGVFPEAEWQQILEQRQPVKVIAAANGLGDTAPDLLELAYLNWQTGDRPHWSTVLPYYGQSPV